MMMLRTLMIFLMASLVHAVARGQEMVHLERSRTSLLCHEVPQPAWSRHHERPMNGDEAHGDGISDGAQEDSVYVIPVDWEPGRVQAEYARTLWIHNAGSSTVLLDSVSVTGKDSADFIVPGDFRNVSIPPRTRVGVDITFAPDEPGLKQALMVLHITPVQSNEVATILRAWALGGPIHTVDYDFGYMSFYGPEKKYENAGRPMEFWAPEEEWFDSVTITQFSFSSATKDGVNDFRWELASGTLPVTLKRGERLAINAWFKPQVPGMRWASLTAITSSGESVTSNWTAGSGVASAGDQPGTADAGVSVFPNPATGTSFSVRYNASSAPLDVRLVDASGRVLRSFGIGRSERGKGELSVDIAGIPAGRYFLHVGGMTTVPVTIVR